MDWRHPSIITVTGPPFSGKTGTASMLAIRIRPQCTFFSLEGILHTLSPPSYSATAPPPPKEAERLLGQAFDILCRVVEKQLRLGVSVVLDSPFSSRAQLDRLVCLSTSLNATKFVIVECQIKRKYAWQRRFDQDKQTPRVGPDVWFKPQSWEDATKLMDGHDAQLDEPIPGVSRLLVNADTGLVTQERCDSIILAVQCLIFREHDTLVDLDKFWENNIAYTRGKDVGHHTASSSNSKALVGFGKRRQKDRFCKGGHYIAIFEAQGLDYETTCGVCEEPVLGPAYACNSCRFAIHKSCAEMPEPNNNNNNNSNNNNNNNNNNNKRSLTPHEFQAAVIVEETTHDKAPIYSLPETHACRICTEEGRTYNFECSSCVFESFLKCRLIPTILDHVAHDHLLSLMPGYIQRLKEYKCSACGLGGSSAVYRCTICDNIIYHAECALLPYPLMHKHGGYEHLLELEISRDKELEDYPCDFCLDMMNPEDWYYYCPQCPQTYHLRCAFEDHS